MFLRGPKKKSIRKEGKNSGTLSGQEGVDARIKDTPNPAVGRVPNLGTPHSHLQRIGVLGGQAVDFLSEQDVLFCLVASWAMEASKNGFRISEIINWSVISNHGLQSWNIIFIACASKGLPPPAKQQALIQRNYDIFPSQTTTYLPPQNILVLASGTKSKIRLVKDIETPIKGASTAMFLAV